MLKEERHRSIVDLLRRNGKVLATDLVMYLKVSEDTIRRDLNELAEAGILQRVHGGALLRSPAIASYEQRLQEGYAAKVAIASAAAELVHDGQVVIMDSGTTVHEIANQFSPDLHATVVTNSVPVAATLVHHPHIEVLMLGGMLKKDAQAMIGVPVIESLRQIRADLCFLGICSLHPEIGISLPDMEEAHIKRVMIQQAAEVVAVTEAAKLGTAAPYIIGPLNALTYLVTDDTIDEISLAEYRQQGITLVRAAL